LLPLFQFAPPYVRLVIAYESVMVNETVLVVTAVHMIVVLSVAINVGHTRAEPPKILLTCASISFVVRRPSTIRSPEMVALFIVAFVVTRPDELTLRYCPDGPISSTPSVLTNELPKYTPAVKQLFVLSFILSHVLSVVVTTCITYLLLIYNPPIPVLITPEVVISPVAVTVLDAVKVPVFTDVALIFANEVVPETSRSCA